MRRREFAYARKRASMRAVDKMARDIAGRDATCAGLRFDRKGSPMSQERRRLLDSLKSRIANEGYWARIVFFGAAQFGHTRRGPLPRKALITALGLRVPVILMDEYNTSNMCPDCGNKLKSVKDSRVFQCARGEGCDNGCSVRFINRDRGAAANIGHCGACQLLGKPRPAALARPTN